MKSYFHLWQAEKIQQAVRKRAEQKVPFQSIPILSAYWREMMIWYDMICYVMLCYVMIWYDMIWYDMITLYFDNIIHLHRIILKTGVSYFWKSTSCITLLGGEAHPGIGRLSWQAGTRVWMLLHFAPNVGRSWKIYIIYTYYIYILWIFGCYASFQLWDSSQTIVCSN